MPVKGSEMYAVVSPKEARGGESVIFLAGLRLFGSARGRGLMRDMALSGEK